MLGVLLVCATHGSAAAAELVETWPEQHAASSPGLMRRLLGRAFGGHELDGMPHVNLHIDLSKVRRLCCGFQNPMREACQAVWVEKSTRSCQHTDLRAVGLGRLLTGALLAEALPRGDHGQVGPVRGVSHPRACGRAAAQQAHGTFSQMGLHLSPSSS